MSEEGAFVADILFFLRDRSLVSPRPNGPALVADLHRDLCACRHHANRERQSRAPRHHHFLKRWEHGRSPPSTIKRITGYAYGFRCSDPPFILLIAAPARPFNSHQE